MSASNDKSYYLDREKKERALAEAAPDPAAKKVHEDLADRYREVADSGRFGEDRSINGMRLAAQ